MFWDPDKPGREQFEEVPKYDVGVLTPQQQLILFTEYTIALYNQALEYENRIFYNRPLSQISDQRAKSEFTARCKFLMEKGIFSPSASINLEVICPKWIEAGVSYETKKGLICEHEFFNLKQWLIINDNSKWRELLLVSTEGYLEQLNDALQTNILVK